MADDHEARNATYLAVDVLRHGRNGVIAIGWRWPLTHTRKLDRNRGRKMRDLRAPLFCVATVTVNEDDRNSHGHMSACGEEQDREKRFHGIRVDCHDVSSHFPLRFLRNT